MTIFKFLFCCSLLVALNASDVEPNLYMAKPKETLSHILLLLKDNQENLINACNEHDSAEVERLENQREKLEQRRRNLKGRSKSI